MDTDNCRSILMTPALNLVVAAADAATDVVMDVNLQGLCAVGVKVQQRS